MFKGQFRLYNLHNIEHLDNFKHISNKNIKVLSNYKKSVFCKKYKRPYYLIKSKAYRQSILGNIALFFSVFFD